MWNDRQYQILKEMEQLAFDRMMLCLKALQDELQRNAGFNQNQPRHPAGTSEGGQWSGGGGGSMGRFEPMPRTVTNPQSGGYSNNLTGVNPGNYVDSDGKSRPVPKTWNRPAKFQEHLKHAKDFGAKSGTQYAKMAEDFRIKAIKEKLPAVMNKDGYVKIYDPKTNSFGVYNPDGKAENYFKPRHGERYFQNEIKKTLEKGGKVINPLPARGGGGGYVDPKKPFSEFPDDNILKYLKSFIERKYFSTTEDCVINNIKFLRKNMNETEICPVCGHAGLSDNYDDIYDICLSCSFHFGVTDRDLGYNYKEWRDKWIQDGMTWRGNKNLKPKNWDPKRQLLNIGVKI